jgi:carbonic anhydrase
MKVFIEILTIAAIFTLAQSSTGSDWNYYDQDSWPGICTEPTSYRQSPINIITKDVKCFYGISPLSFNKEYLLPMSGKWKNKGYTVVFIPDRNVNAIITTPVGQYKLTEFHMHWGEFEGEGSEHLIDNRASELEIHFVHKNIDDTARDAYAYAVLGVRGSLKDAPITGTDTFEQLDVSNIRSYSYSTPKDVSGIHLRSLMPPNRFYYYYNGSLTTPDCKQAVQWFIMKQEIKVPEYYLTNLRKVRDKDRYPIKFNYRYTQPLHWRKVYKVC